MITVGYGDIVPITPQEIIFTIMSIIFSCIIFGYLLNKLGSIFSAVDDA